ncbi:hypothetical protein [Streptomyces sp. KL116D]|uniref:AMP-binding enzyme n=1 Tax=Streptomyces sp. KL116D TaxID=3045152 RepID=UPI003556B40B
MTLRDAEGPRSRRGSRASCASAGSCCAAARGRGRGRANARALAGGHYRTGDHASERAGLFSFAGRKDHQVKIDGHRVEPEGVESVLLEHPGVREAVCLVTGRESLARSLAAIVVGGAGQAELQEFLHARLPASMVPRRFVVVDALPLTSTGKADRLAAERLLAPGRQRSRRSHRSVIVERQVVPEVRGQRRVGRQVRRVVPPRRAETGRRAGLLVPAGGALPLAALARLPVQGVGQEGDADGRAVRGDQAGASVTRSAESMTAGGLALRAATAR